MPIRLHGGTLLRGYEAGLWVDDHAVFHIYSRLHSSRQFSSSTSGRKKSPQAESERHAIHSGDYPQCAQDHLEHKWPPVLPLSARFVTCGCQHKLSYPKVTCCSSKSRSALNYARAAPGIGSNIVLCRDTLCGDGIAGSSSKDGPELANPVTSDRPPTPPPCGVFRACPIGSTNRACLACLVMRLSYSRRMRPLLPALARVRGDRGGRRSAAQPSSNLAPAYA